MEKDPYEDTVQDIQLKYSGCIFALDIKDRTIPAILNEVKPMADDGGNSLFQGIFTDVMMKQTVTKHLDFEEYPKEKLRYGAINLPQSVVYVEPILNQGSPYKYRVLPSPETILVFDAFYKERELLRSPQITPPYHPAFYKAWVENEYVEPHQAIEDVVAGKFMARAFSPSHYVGIKDSCNYIGIFLRKNMIGRVDPHDLSIHLEEGMAPFADELLEFGLVVNVGGK